MKGNKIQEILEENWPLEYALEWDNVGLLVGDPNQEVYKIMVALDLTDEVLEQAIANDADMIVTHHPILFSGIKKIVSDDLNGRRLIRMLTNRIIGFSMHTNFDVTAMADLNAKSLNLSECKVLMETGRNAEGNPVGIGKTGLLPKTMTLKECAEYVKTALKIPDVRVYGDLEKMVQSAAISGGSGKSMTTCALEKNVQVLITGDIDYHTGIDSVANGLAIIDAGHYGTEYIFMEYVSERLKELLPDVSILKADEKAPFVVQ